MAYCVEPAVDASNESRSYFYDGILSPFLALCMVSAIIGAGLG
jgi:hypothetical protein